jgi:hypothetical protein
MINFTLLIVLQIYFCKKINNYQKKRINFDRKLIVYIIGSFQLTSETQFAAFYKKEV